MKKSVSKSSSGGIPPIIAAGIVLVAIGIVAFFLWHPTSMENPIIPNPGTDTLTPLTGIPTFSSEAALVAAFKDARERGGMSVDKREAMNSISAPTAAGASGAVAADSSGSSPAYSGTNVQVQGVDEADIVKTDGEYIYTFYKNKVVITKAVPATDMKVVHTLFLDDVSPQEMVVQGNQLILIGNTYSSGPNVYASKISAMPYCCYWNYSRSVIRVYDISDKENPLLKKELEFPGSYVSSRVTGGSAYFVLTTYPEYRILDGEVQGESIIPPYKEDGVEKKLAAATDIAYLPPLDAQSFITVVSMDLSTLHIEKETIVGRADQVYASQDNLYLSATQYNYGWGGVMPMMRAAVDDALPGASGSDTVGDNVQKTLIYKFHLNGGAVSFEGRGQVPGTVLNQFSMDEFDGKFRIATTLDATWGPTGQEIDKQRNAVYILDEKMKTVGSLEDLAPGERIYSARFMGDRAYLVTFKQVDPLFVLDLSNARAPKVLGKLKIPGFSNYLHPFDRTHIIGIGKDTEESKQGDFAYNLGMKLALFDVSDVEHPVQVSYALIGDRGTDSPALYDHKAFLFDAAKGLLVLPIDLHEVQGSSGTTPSWGPEYGESVFQGAFVYHLDLENGFQELGRITHISPEVDLKSGYYYDYRYQVQRSLYIGDVLYTVSQKVIKANDLANELKEISSVETVNTPSNFVITARVQGVFCAGECGYQQIMLSKTKMITDNVSGGENPTIYHSEQPPYSTYDDIVETLDWDAFKSLDATQGCPGCADGAVFTITITKGNETKTVKMEAGMKVEKIQAFLDAISSYVGLYGGGGIYYPLAADTVGVSTGSSAPPATPTVEPAPAE